MSHCYEGIFANPLLFPYNKEGYIGTIIKGELRWVDWLHGRCIVDNISIRDIVSVDYKLIVLHATGDGYFRIMRANCITISNQIHPVGNLLKWFCI